MPKTEDLANKLKAAGLFDVYRWSEYPQVKTVCNALFDEVIAYRKEQKPKARVKKPKQIKKHLRIILIDLYVASQSSNPWQGVSKRKEEYKKNVSRYRRLHLTYDFLIPLINDLGSLGYIEEATGFHDPITKKGFRTRIRATEKLIGFIERKEFGVLDVIEKVGLAGLVIDNPEAERETIILRGNDGKLLEYEDTDETKVMRYSLAMINAKLTKTRIVLRTSNEQLEALFQRLNGSDDDREHVDFSRQTLYRVFNGDFHHGGRFYGGWWIGLPKEYRKYIEINRKETVEVDFSGHHIRMLYARDGLEPPKDPYEIENCPFNRDVLKQVFLVLINASDKKKTIKACQNKHGIKEASEVLKYLETHHQKIAHHFYTGIGLTLQYEDSVLAEEVMLRMMNRGATVLPVHDSFIVRNSYQQELEEVMKEVFAERYQAKAVMKTKPTVLDKDEDEDDVDTGNWKDKVVTDDIEEIYKNEENYSMVNRIWGGG